MRNDRPSSLPLGTRHFSGVAGKVVIMSLWQPEEVNSRAAVRLRSASQPS